MTDQTDRPCNAATMHRLGNLATAHGPHPWVVQPGMEPVHCPGAELPDDQTERRDRYAKAARTVRLRLGPNALAMAQRGEPIILNMGEADDLADAVMAVADAEQAELRERYMAGLRRADEINNQLMEEVQRYADGTERPVLWSVYNETHKRALKAEAEAHQYRTALQGVARREAAAAPAVDRAAPTDWIDGHPQLEAIAAAVWEQCGRSDSGMCIEDEPRNIAVAALSALAVLTATGRAATLREAADALAALDPAEAALAGQHAWNDAAAELRRLADETPDAEAHPPHHRWYVETCDGLADEWAPGMRFDERAEAVERYEVLTEHHPLWKDGTPVERRLVRETTTYTVEQPAAGARQDGPTP